MLWHRVARLKGWNRWQGVNICNTVKQNIKYVLYWLHFLHILVWLYARWKKILYTAFPDVFKIKNMYCIKYIFFFSLWSSVSVPKSSTTETMKTLPFLGQFLGRLCWNPYVTAGGEFTLWTASSPSVVALKATRQAHVIMTVMILTWFVMCCVAVVVCCLQIQAEGCCSSVCGDCTRSSRAMLWKEKPTSGYRYNFINTENIRYCLKFFLIHSVLACGAY